MSEVLDRIVGVCNEEQIKYALLDEAEAAIRILIRAEDKKKIDAAARKAGWRRLKDKSKDLYLYGMDHFQYYDVAGVRLTVCCQLACRSTLNGEWVPLDRKINNFALDRVCDKDGYKSPCPEDFLCYLLAKCVYTEKAFSQYDIARIEQCMREVAEPELSTKLEGVFFYFTPTILKMIDAKDYDNIIESLICYAEY